jgi:hypothetical protein
MEGLTYGTAKVRLELIEIATGQALKIDEVQVTVKCGRWSSNRVDSGSSGGDQDARHLRGFRSASTRPAHARCHL